jgi:hypothetical protein
MNYDAEYKIARLRAVLDYALTCALSDNLRRRIVDVLNDTDPRLNLPNDAPTEDTAA